MNSLSSLSGKTSRQMISWNSNRRDWVSNYLNHSEILQAPGITAAETPVKLSLQWRHNGRDGISNQQPYDLFIQPRILAQIKENIKALRHWLCDWWIPHTKSQ